MNAYSNPRQAPEARHVSVASVAVVLSLVAHFVLYQTVGDRRFALFDPVAAETRNAARHPPATLANLVPPPTPSPPSEDPLRTDAGHGLDGVGDFSGLLDRLGTPSPASIFEPPPSTAELLPTPSVEQLAPPPAPDLPAWQPRQEILSILDARARDEMAPVPRREIPAIERQSMAPDLTVAYDLLAGLPSAETAGVAVPTLLTPLAANLAPAAMPAGGNEAWPVPNLGPEAEGDTSTTLMAEIPSAVAPGHPLDDRLRIAVETFAPPSSADAGYLYFRIDVTRKDDEALLPLSRDVVFVQDTSASLGERYLVPSRLALKESFRMLRPDDRFEVVQFSQQATRCFAGWRAATPETLQEADAFVDAMVPGGQTDLFASMSEVLSLPRVEGRPMLAVVVTDGNVTAGGMERDSQIIGTFSRLNAGEVSVFTVGTSPRANLFLLDMLSYCNRGGNTAVAPDRFTVSETIQTAVAGIARPLLTGIRFNFDVVSGAEVYPDLTTNLFQDRPLQLFGRVRADRPVVAFQARGNAGTRRYDMLFEVDLRGPGVRPGAASLATQWATQRMYDLVSRFARTEDATLIAEMHRLGSTYGIPVPYRAHLQP